MMIYDNEVDLHVYGMLLLKCVCNMKFFALYAGEKQYYVELDIYLSINRYTHT